MLKLCTRSKGFNLTVDRISVRQSNEDPRPKYPASNKSSKEKRTGIISFGHILLYSGAQILTNNNEFHFDKLNTDRFQSIYLKV